MWKLKVLGFAPRRNQVVALQWKFAACCQFLNLLEVRLDGIHQQKCQAMMIISASRIFLQRISLSVVPCENSDLVALPVFYLVDPWLTRFWGTSISVALVEIAPLASLR